MTESEIAFLVTLLRTDRPTKAEGRNSGRETETETTEWESNSSGRQVLVLQHHWHAFCTSCRPTTLFPWWTEEGREKKRRDFQTEGLKRKEAAAVSCPSWHFTGPNETHVLISLCSRTHRVVLEWRAAKSVEYLRELQSLLVVDDKQKQSGLEMRNRR